jgi:hypothetical protein
MKKKARSISVLAGVLLFSGLIVIAGGSMGWQGESALPIYPGEFCREAMTEELGALKEEIDQLRATSARATSGPAHR